MNTAKIALYTKPDETLTLTPAESIISMFDHTDESGVLYIPEWPYDDILDMSAIEMRSMLMRRIVSAIMLQPMIWLSVQKDCANL